MKFDVEALSPVKRRLRIEIPPDIVSREIEGAFQSVRRRAKVPGFRPGKAPRTLLERQYGHSIQQEVIEKLIPDSYREAVRQSGIRPVDFPVIEEVALRQGEPLSFTATVEVRPEVKVSEYRGIPVPGVSTAVTDEETAKALDQIREMHAQLEVAEEGRRVEPRDFAVIDYEGFLDGQPLQGAGGSDVMAEVGSGRLLPEFEEQLPGCGKGEVREFDVAYPPDYRNPQVAGKAVHFRVSVKEIKKKRLPDLNEEFAQLVGAPSLDQLRESLRQELLEAKRGDGERRQKAALLQTLRERYPQEIPDSLVQRQIENYYRDIAVAGKAREQIRPQLESAARNEILGVLILDAIAQQEGLAVEQQEVEEALQRIAKESKRPLPAVRQQYMKETGALEDLRGHLLREKALDWLLARAQVQQET
jgi:trigger factor